MGNEAKFGKVDESPLEYNTRSNEKPVTQISGQTKEETGSACQNL